MAEISIYWKNEGHPCIDQPCTANAVQVVGVFTGMEDFEQIRWIAMRQESAFDYDHYHQHDDLKIHQFAQNGVEIIERFKNQKADSRLGSVYPGIRVATISDARYSLKESDGGRINKSKIFVPSTTPTQFNFTGVFLLNNGTQGALHSFLRHHDKWADVVPNMQSYLNRMQPVIDSIQAIQRASNMSSARSLTFEFMEKLGNLNESDFNSNLKRRFNECKLVLTKIWFTISEVQSALNEVQLEMVESLQKHLDYGSYLGEGVNQNNQLQTYFKMNSDLVAVIGYSRELFVEEPSFDRRPFRTIITIYFIDYVEYRRRYVMTSY